MLSTLQRIYSHARYFPRHVSHKLDAVMVELLRLHTALDEERTARLAFGQLFETGLGDMKAATATIQASLGEVRGVATAVQAGLHETRTAIATMQASHAREIEELNAFTQDFSEKLKLLSALAEDVRGTVFSQLNNAIAAHDRIATRAYELTAAEIATEKGAIDGVQDRLREQGTELRHLRETVAAQAPVLPSWFWTEGSADSVRAILRLIQPQAVRDHVKARLGRDYDGGYVMLDDLAGAQAAISLGINDDVSWDQAVAARGIPVHQYDHTIAAPPEQHPLFSFAPIRVATVDGPGALSLDSILRSRIADGQTDLLLKIDIESDEWPVLEAADATLLGSCRQIVCEFHDLRLLGEATFRARARAVFEKLASRFFICHVHGNNCGSIVNVANITLPESLEITFVNRARYQPKETNELFPTPLDMPNQPGRADIFLGAFRF